jgi:hypothetical protein
VLGACAEVVGELRPSPLAMKWANHMGSRRLPIITGQSEPQEGDASYPGSPRRLQVLITENAAVEPWEFVDSDRVPSYSL